MEPLRPGDVVLLSFPFTDMEGSRRRPALVLMDTGDEDIMVARVTSQATRDQFDTELTEWESAGLLIPSIVRVHKLATVRRRLVDRRLGTLGANDWTRVRELIRQLWVPL